MNHGRSKGPGRVAVADAAVQSGTEVVHLLDISLVRVLDLNQSLAWHAMLFSGFPQ